MSLLQDAEKALTAGPPAPAASQVKRPAPKPAAASEGDVSPEEKRRRTEEAARRNGAAGG